MTIYGLRIWSCGKFENSEMEKVVDLFGVGEANSEKLLKGGIVHSSIVEATNKDLLKSSDVTHILIVDVALAPPYPLDFVYKVIEVVDRSETDLAVYVDECYSFIDKVIQSGGVVLVHCYMGMSRRFEFSLKCDYSGGLSDEKHVMSFSKAMELVRSRRPQALPNFGFISQLQQFEKSIQAHGEDSADKKIVS